MEDIRIIQKISGKLVQRKSMPTQPCMAHSSQTPQHQILYDARIDDGRLYYDKKWYALVQRGVAVS